MTNESGKVRKGEGKEGKETKKREGRGEGRGKRRGRENGKWEREREEGRGITNCVLNKYAYLSMHLGSWTGGEHEGFLEAVS